MVKTEDREEGFKQRDHKERNAAKPQPQMGDRNGDGATRRRGEKPAHIEWITRC
jgi:hypothetical protein